VRALAALLVLASPALAEAPPPGSPKWVPIGGEAFEALVEGRTLTYAPPDSEVWGVERFRPGRRVTWARIGAECLDGVWYPAGPEEAPQVCFAYEDGSGPHCFLFYRSGEHILSTNLDGGQPELSVDAPPELAIGGCDYLGS
jgi:hypothetical protein